MFDLIPLAGTRREVANRELEFQIIGQGLGLEIRKSEVEDDSIEVELVERYEPLIQPPPKSSELVVPTIKAKPSSKLLVLPGQAGYTG